MGIVPKSKTKSLHLNLFHPLYLNQIRGNEGMSLNTYVKMGEAYLHVFIHISDKVMSLRSIQGFPKDLK